MLRALIACAPALPVFALLAAAIRRAAWEGWLTDHPGVALLAPLLVLAALALSTIARPQQGPRDWLARVWVVLR